MFAQRFHFLGYIFSPTSQIVHKLEKVFFHGFITPKQYPWKFNLLKAPDTKLRLRKIRKQAEAEFGKAQQNLGWAEAEIGAELGMT